jgi:FkbM family methyltransferase
MSIHSTYYSLLWKFGRRLYMIARNDLTLTPEKNGEYWIQEKLVASFPENYNFVVFDIGANIGEWSSSIINISKHQKNNKGSLHLFEPTKDTYEFLQNFFAGSNDLLKINHLAVGDSNKEILFYVNGELSAVNSIHQQPNSTSEKVQLIRLDDYISANQIKHIDMVKSDTEGNDCRAIFGAEKALIEGKIDLWQFEYNHKWIDSKNYLKDVFKFIEDKDYMVGKLCTNQIQVYDKWEPELERFFEANYLLIKKENKLVKKIGKYFKYDQSNILVLNRSKRFWWS